MNAPREKLAADFQILMSDVEELARATASQTGDKITELRGRVQRAAAELRPRLAEMEALAREKAKVVAATTDTYVHDHPWGAVGVSAGIGIIIGILIGRR